MSDETENNDGAQLDDSGNESSESQDSGQSSAGAENEQQSDSRPAYQPHVDLSGLPDEIRAPVEARFKHVSWLMKKNESKLGEWQELAAEQSRRIEELTNGFVGMATHLQDKTFTETEAQYKQAMRAAMDSGDNEAYIDAQEKLHDLKAEKRMAAMQKKAAPAEKKNAAPAQEYDEAEVSPAVQAWQEERDASGQQIRAWALPSHPEYNRAYAELYAIKANPATAKWSEENVMKELDRRMGVQKSAPRQNVMGGGLTGGNKPSKMTLHPKAEEVAVRMKLGGPTATREQHIQAYYKVQLEESKKKGTR